MSEHVQPVLDNIETVEEDKHCHYKARLQKKILNGRNWCGSLFVKALQTLRKPLCLRADEFFTQHVEGGEVNPSVKYDVADYI